MLKLPTEFGGCGKKFLVSHALSCHIRGLVLAWHNDAANEWGALVARALNPSCISYKPKINSRNIQGERNGDVARIVTRGQGEMIQANCA